MKLQEIMVKEVIQALPDETIAGAAQRMDERGVGCLVVTVEGAVKGIITDRDLLACLGQAHDPYRCKISAHMRRPVIVLRPEEDHATAAEVMRAKRIKRLPIASSGKLLGIVSLSDLAVIANEEATRLGSSLSFFTSVVRAQSSQHNLPQTPIRQPPAAAAAVELANNNTRGAMLDVGGPG
jgi:CBS domain-containing protein